MPTYTFKNLETGEVADEIISISEMEKRIASGKYQRIYANPPALVSSYGLKPPDGFREVLKRVKKGAGKSSTVNTW